jgi:hypothetical protein
MATTTTIAGDYWDEIAVRVYGSEIYTPVLQRSNPAFAGVVEFDAGIEIECPQVQITASIGNQPWYIRFVTI